MKSYDHNMVKITKTIQKIKNNDDPAFGFFHDEFPQWVTLRVAYDDITIVIILNIRNEQTLS